MIGLIGFSSCNDETIISQPAPLNVITVTSQDFTDGEISTRASFNIDGSGFHFSWTRDDTVGIYPVGGDQVAFPISSGMGSQTAQFDGGAWALRSTYSYAAYYPFSSGNYHVVETSLPVCFNGQSQNGNGSLATLDRFDFQASIATRPDANGNVNISLKHLGCFTRFQFTMPEANSYKSIELKSSNTPFIASGTVDLTSDSIHITPIMTSQTLHIDLYNVSTTTQDPVLVVYAMLAPIDLNKSQISAIITGTNEKTYSFVLMGKTMFAGKAYNYTPKNNESNDDIVPPDNEIWYTTNDNTIIDLDASYIWYNTQPFDAKVISHTYKNGKGIIKCDGPIKLIHTCVFGNGQFKKITSIYLPNSIEELEMGALKGTGVEELRIPDNLKCVGSRALSSNTFKRFYGKHTSADGRCVILENGYINNETWLDTVNNYMAGFAPSGLSKYTVPKEIEIIGECVFASCPELKGINFNEGLKKIDYSCFEGNNFDCDIVLPSSLEYLAPNAFYNCSGIKGFYGNEKFHTADHLCLTAEYDYWWKPEWIGTWIIKFVGTELEDYTIPVGIKGISGGAFLNLPNLHSVTFPSSLAEIDHNAFSNCPNLEFLYGDCVSNDHKGIVFDNQFRRLLIEGITRYVVQDGIKSIGFGAFEGLPNIEEIIISDNVTELGGYDFSGCPKLKKVVLSANLKAVGGMGYNPFIDSYNLEEIYFRSYLPPTYSDTQFLEDDCEHLTVYVPEKSLDLYKKSGWSQYAPYMVGYKYTDIDEDPDYYISTDLTQDGNTEMLQKSITGAGINLILMGDAFSDRLIADGTYVRVMKNTMNALFSEEPFKSYKNYFNVYSVNVVSKTEGYEHGGQALGTGFGDDDNLYGNNQKVIEYAKKVVTESIMDDALIIVIMNQDAYAGTCYMYDAPDGDYGRGLSIAYLPANSITENFNGLVLHEAGGHGFAKLADEYSYEQNGMVTYGKINSIKVNEQYGWWKNIDFTNNITQVKWSQFISDSRYANENIGCYEGGLTYWSGVWRPTENSIMRYNNGKFNAPSRYAIWYRINKLAYGENWNGTYEDFVEYDAINRTSSAVSKRVQPRHNYVEKPLPTLAPPVAVGHSWRDAY